MSKVEIIDDFLNNSDWLKIQKMMVSEDNDAYLPWYYKDVKVPGQSSKHNCQLVHVFYENYSPTSQCWGALMPILEKLRPSAIIRIKANLTMATDRHVIYGMHQDTNNAKTAIYYVNSNNGYTLFGDGTRVESVQNRLAIFDSDLEHSGTSCTDAKFRCVINIIYLP